MQRFGDDQPFQIQLFICCYGDWILSCPGVHKAKEIVIASIDNRSIASIIHVASMEYSLPVSDTHAGNKRDI